MSAVTDWWQWFVDLAQVLSGFAALAAIWVAVGAQRSTDRQYVEAQEEKRRQLAAQVTAWAVSEGSIDEGAEGLDGGVVIRNNGIDAVTAVDVKTQCRNEPRTDLADDGHRGQRFSLIPPGVYYLQQKDAGTWSAPIPVDTSGGKLVVALEQDGGSRAVVDLVPIARIPEPKTVAFLGFTIGSERWQRDEYGRLGVRQPTPWEAQFAESEGARLNEPQRRPKDYSRYTWGGGGSFSKYDTIHFIVQRFIELNGIKTREEFQVRYAAEVARALGATIGKRALDPDKLLDRVGATTKYAARDEKFIQEFGPIVFDGVSYRGGYTAGLGVLADHGRVVLKPLIEHFSRLPGYDIEPVA